MKPGKEALERLLELPREAAERIVREIGTAALRRLAADWPAWVHAGQEPPSGEDWAIWVMLGGRGFGKTRAGAEWISQLARDEPRARIALVAANLDEARKVMVEGPAGLIAVARPGAEAEKMRWQPGRRKLRFASGAEAFLYSGAHGDSLRGAAHHYAWCDELAKWRQAQLAWDNLVFGLRIGANPRALVTTTPRPIAALKAIIGGGETARSGGGTRDNPHLPARFVAAREREYRDTRLGPQELDGKLIEDPEGALWTAALIGDCRMEEERMDEERKLERIVIGVDPPASVDGTCGIVVCGIDRGGIGYVLADASVAGLSPEGWARRVASAAEIWRAELVIAEANNGGAMVAAVLRGAEVAVPVKLVHAAEGKVARAAPVAALFERRRVRIAGRFPALEDQLCGLTWDGRYHPGSGSGAGGRGPSPDRADAMVWALTELMLGPRGDGPRIQRL